MAKKKRKRQRRKKTRSQNVSARETPVQELKKEAPPKQEKHIKPLYLFIPVILLLKPLDKTSATTAKVKDVSILVFWKKTSKGMLK